MANYTNLNDLFTDMANAIRDKKNSTANIVADNFPTEIENLRTGFDYVNPDVTEIPDYAFYGCEDLQRVDCYNVTSVGASAFENCTNLKTGILYDGVTEVGENTFKGCNCIIFYKGSNIPESWNENWNPDECIVIFGEAIEIYNISNSENDNVNAELYMNNDKYTLLITGKGNMKTFTASDSKVAPWSSYSADIENILIYDGVTSIGNYAFSDCIGLTSITIPNSVTRIRYYAFDSCKSLTSINIPDGVTSIDSYAFCDCIGLTSITIPNSVTSIGYNAFQFCTGLKTAGPIGGGYNYEFGWTTSIPGYAFYNCFSLTSITIPDSVTSIGDWTFRDCIGLTSITIPDGVTSIGNWIFDGCKSLTSINIPDSIISIGNYAFKNCTGLTSITYTGTISQWNSITFGTDWNNATGNYTIHCTDGDIAKDGTITYHTTT